MQKTSAWQDRYFQETAADLTGGLQGSAVEGVPRLANFPYGEVSWTQQNSYMKKHAMEGISWEDAKTNGVDVIARTLLRIARAVAKSVDTEIWDVITEGRSVTNINATPSVAAWDAATGQDPIADVLSGCMLIANQNYNPMKNGYLLVSPKGYKSLTTWLISTKGASIPTFASEKVVNGKVGMDELFTFIREKIFIIIVADRKLRCVLGWAVVWIHTHQAIQQVVDKTPKAK